MEKGMAQSKDWGNHKADVKESVVLMGPELMTRPGLQEPQLQVRPTPAQSQLVPSK